MLSGAEGLSSVRAHTCRHTRTIKASRVTGGKDCRGMAEGERSTHGHLAIALQEAGNTNLFCGQKCHLWTRKEEVKVLQN